jgi:hypothetical protein
LVGRREGGGEEVGDLRLSRGVAAGLVLESAIGAGQPVLALSDVLRPGGDEEGLDECGGFTAIAE